MTRVRTQKGKEATEGGRRRKEKGFNAQQSGRKGEKGEAKVRAI